MSTLDNNCVCVTHAGFVKIYSADKDMTLKVEEYIPGATACQMVEQGVVLGFQNGTIQLFDSELQPLSNAEPLHSDKVIDIVANKRVIASCSSDGTVSIWNRTLDSQATYQTHYDLSHGLDLNSATESIISVGYDGRLVATSFLSGNVIQEKIISTKSLYCCKFSPNGKKIVVGGFGAVVDIVDSNSFDSLDKPKNIHNSSVWCIEWLDNDNLIVVGWDNDIVIYNLKDKSVTKIPYICYNSKIAKVAGGVLISSAIDRNITYFETDKWTAVNSIEIESEQNIRLVDVKFEKCFGLSPTRNLLLSAAGATIKEPISVVQQKFKRRRKLLIRRKKQLQEVEQMFGELFLTEDARWVFPQELADPRSILDDVERIVENLIIAMAEDGISDNEIIADLREIVTTREPNIDVEMVNHDRLFKRLETLQGTGTLVSRLIEQLMQMMGGVI